jgi:phage/plasmid-associated DNA primase
LCPHNVASSLESGEFSPSQGLFKGLLDQVTEGDDEKLNLLSQMFGALLFPLNPQIFFILGEPNNGKSTIAKVALNLVGIQNCSSVSPNRLYGFNLHQTMGKRVNYDLDIPTRYPLTDDTLKKVIDQVPIQIERKNRDSVQATLPPVHLYVGNELPNLGEGSAKPFERRVSFINVTAKEVTAPIRNLHEQILSKELDHVLIFAIRGALSLWASGGAYAQTESKKAALAEWELASSPEKDFVDLLNTDGVPVYDEDGKFTGDRLFFGDGYVSRTILANSAKKVYGQALRKNLLFKAICKYGASVSAHQGTRTFKGIITKRDTDII